ncbi:MAG: hypothetical protein V5A43_04015 [Haloarculaceae archaeon]
MESDTAARSVLEADSDVMASVEDGPTERFVVADVTEDEAYLTLPLEDAASLPAWR